MKNMPRLAALVMAVVFIGALPVTAQQNRISPHETISAHIGNPRSGPLVTITYGRPYSKEPRGTNIRTIWGGLVPWGKAWRMGSDEATTLITQVPLDFAGTTVPAGAYTLYLVPMEADGSKLAISTKIGQWGIPVDETKDLARVDVKKEPMDNQIDQFTMSVANDAATGGGIIKMMWEKTQFSVAFTVKK